MMPRMTEARSCSFTMPEEQQKANFQCEERRGGGQVSSWAKEAAAGGQQSACGRIRVENCGIVEEIGRCRGEGERMRNGESKA